MKVYGQTFFGWYIQRYVPQPSNVNSLNVFFGIVPILDLIAGVWNFSTWGQTNQQWENAYYFELSMSFLMLIAWLTVFERSKTTQFAFFNQMAAVYVLIEIINLFLVYQAEDTTPNTVDQATNYAYFSHVFGLLMSLVFSGYETINYNQATNRS